MEFLISSWLIFCIVAVPRLFVCFAQAMTSNAKLIAFDDLQNKAILKFENGKLFACPSDFVSVPFTEQVSTALIYINTSAYPPYTTKLVKH